jgi:hypothetical protein
MFENPLNSIQNTYILDKNHSENIHTRRYNTALNQFKASLLRGKFFRIKAKMLHRPSFLQDLNAAKPGLLLQGSFYAGTKVVRIDSIIGSEGRTSDFDMEFHPISEEAQQRWVSVAVAYLQRLPLPPVELIQVGDAYFVRDGHHRISVSRAFGQVAVDAEVVTWNATPPFPWQPVAAFDRLFLPQTADLSPQ